MFLRGREVRFNLIGGRALSPPNLYWFLFSGALILLSLVALVTMGINWGIEFKGGYLMKLRLERPADVEEVRGMLGEFSQYGLENTIVQTSEEGKVLSLRMPYIEDPDVRKATVSDIKDRLDRSYGIVETLEEEQVGSEWGREVSRKAVIALAVFLVVILVYITLRLEFKMAVPAILALVHDTFITVGIYALTRRQVTPVTVIAFLTILGYSLYDTIVVFDRVEENSNLLGKSGNITYAGIVNQSVNQTLLRSINTTLTTLIPIVTILVFGGETLKDFAFALFLGVLLGGYSSVFIACPLLAMWKEKEPRFAALREKEKLSGEARKAILVRRGPSAAEGVKAVETSARRREKPATSREAVTREAAAEKKAAEGKKPAAAVPASGSPPSRKPSGTAKKKATTKGPAGGKKKKKKKKKKR